MLRDAGEKLVEKKEWDPIRPARPRFRNMSHKDRQLLVNMDPRYGQVICRCENITEGEIIAEIHSPVPARTYDAIKRRTWLGTGRCQGAVSYTHLRAHETPEHLVCRLLLEKKNIHHKHTTNS